jgi:hypothetical protein
MRKEQRTRLETFATDKFDAKAYVAPHEMPAGGAKTHGAKMVKALAAIVPLLDTKQRETLAANLERGSGHGSMRGPRGEHGEHGGRGMGKPE